MITVHVSSVCDGVFNPLEAFLASPIPGVPKAHDINQATRHQISFADKQAAHKTTECNRPRRPEESLPCTYILATAIDEKKKKNIC